MLKEQQENHNEKKKKTMSIIQKILSSHCVPDNILCVGNTQYAKTLPSSVP